MRKNKLLMIAGVMLVLGIFSILFNQILNALNKTKNDDATASDAGYADYYTYNEIEEYIFFLTNSDEQKHQIEMLVDPLKKSDPVSVLYVKRLSEIIGADSNVYTGVVGNRADEETLTKEEFDKIYGYIVGSGVVAGLTRESIYVFDRQAKTDSDGITEYYLYDGEEYHRCDIDIPYEYDDSIVDVYKKNGTIFKVNGHSEDSFCIKNVWVVCVGNGECTFLYEGKTKNYNYRKFVEVATEQDAIIDLSVETGNNPFEQGTTTTEEITTSDTTYEEGFVADLYLDSLGVFRYEKKKDIIDCQITSVEENSISSGENVYPLSDKFFIYDVSNSAFCEECIPVLTGHSSVKLVMNEGKAQVAVIEDELVSENIRVILNNDDFSSYNMNTATISCDAPFTITYPDESVTENVAGSSITIDHKNYEVGDKLLIESTDPTKKLKLYSIARDYGTPEVRGRVEIIIVDGGLRVVNELPLEEYLFSVVAGEMPAGTPYETLKAIAVCARGYAYRKMTDGSYSAYEAHLDDSGACQNYNNAMETDIAIKAVKDTYNVVPKYDGKLILPLYFQTSAGVTCTNAEIWGGNPYAYLKSNIEDIDKTEVDLSSEEIFEQFINDSLSYDTIEKNQPYYRWNITFTREEISQAIKSMLSERISMSADNIRVIDENGNYKNEEISDIGTVNDIRITKRSESGVVLTMEIEGTLSTIEVSGQINVRNLITPVNQEIVRQDGSIVAGWTSLPSPYYYVEKTETGFVIHGGGFGHGAGLSKNGASELADMGYDYKYILNHYFTDVEFDSIYEINTEESE